jgi:hypothetical protein
VTYFLTPKQPPLEVAVWPKHRIYEFEDLAICRLRDVADQMGADSHVLSADWPTQALAGMNRILVAPIRRRHRCSGNMKGLRE